MVSEPDNELDAAHIVSFWEAEAEESLQVAHHLVAKADYSYALFFGHLALEKMLIAKPVRLNIQTNR